MSKSSVVASAARAADLLKGSGAWALLRKDTAPIAIAILGGRLRGDERRLAQPELIERTQMDLEDLRAANMLTGERTAQQYLKTWIDEGFLIRQSSKTRDETLELSQDALTAIRFVDQLITPSRTVTESRLETVLTVLHQLRIETDPDVSARIARLEAQRAQIDQQLAALHAGENITILSDDQAHERVTEAISLLSALPEDFARVRADLELINSDLRASLVEDADSRGAVLEDIFAGIDLLQTSDAGRSFNGFYSLLLDMTRSSALEDDIDAILHRDFAQHLDPIERRNLRRMLPSLHDSAAEIHQVMTTLGRNLRQFVRSRDFVEERRIQVNVRAATTEARTLLMQHAPVTESGFALGQSSVTINSIAGLHLHNPAESHVTETLTLADPAELDLAQLRDIVRRSEIDMDELRANIAATLSEHGDSTLVEVLQHRPATQGVASVIGLVVLAEQSATRLDGNDPVRWQTRPGVWFTAQAPRYLFHKDKAIRKEST